jgi:hypothetical protein
MNQYLITTSVVPDPLTQGNFLVELPLGAVLMFDPNQELDTWVRLHLWPAMGIEPKGKDYTALINAKKLFGAGE